MASLTALAQHEKATENVTNQRTLALLAFAAELVICTTGGRVQAPLSAPQQAELAELLHWLVRGSDLQCAARLAQTGAAPDLGATMVHELLACQNRKEACRYVTLFHLEHTFPLLTSKGGGEVTDTKAVRSQSKRGVHAPQARLPGHVEVVDVRTADSVMKCVAMIVESAAKERAEGRCGVLAMDAEVQR